MGRKQCPLMDTSPDCCNSLVFLSDEAETAEAMRPILMAASNISVIVRFRLNYASWPCFHCRFPAGGGSFPSLERMTAHMPRRSAPKSHERGRILQKASKGLGAGVSCVWFWMVQAEREGHVHFRSSFEGAQSQKGPGGRVADSKPLASVVIDLDDACLACKTTRKNCGGQSPVT